MLETSQMTVNNKEILLYKDIYFLHFDLVNVGEQFNL